MRCWCGEHWSSDLGVAKIGGGSDFDGGITASGVAERLAAPCCDTQIIPSVGTKEEICSLGPYIRRCTAIQIVSSIFFI